MKFLRRNRNSSPREKPIGCGTQRRRPCCARARARLIPNYYTYANKRHTCRVYGGGIRHSGMEGFFLLPFREKRSVFEKTRVKRKGGGRGDSLYKRASESCVKHSQDLFITGEGGYLETEIKLLSRYKYFVRELASKKNVSKFFRCFSPLSVSERLFLVQSEE